MFEAQLLKVDGAEASVSVYSPWLPRVGDHALFTLEVVDVDGHGGGSPSITLRAFTKNAEDTGNGTDADTSTSITRTSGGRTTAEWTSTGSVGFKELVRYKLTLANTGDKGSVWALLRVLPPSWFDAVKA